MKEKNKKIRPTLWFVQVGLDFRTIIIKNYSAFVWA